jgi:hypothetical protein
MTNPTVLFQSARLSVARFPGRTPYPRGIAARPRRNRRRQASRPACFVAGFLTGCILLSAFVCLILS